MKRVLLRIGALGTVVILGWIAIAQAQRGADNRPPSTADLAPVGKASPDDASKTTTTLLPAGARMPLPSSGNPLRGNTAAPTEEPPPTSMPIGDHRASLPAADPAPAEPLGEQTLLDPLQGYAVHGDTLVETVADGADSNAGEMPPASQYAAASSVGNRSMTSQAFVSEPREPAPFHADPSSTPTAMTRPATGIDTPVTQSGGVVVGDPVAPAS